MEVLLSALGGEIRTATVPDPLGRPIEAPFALLPDGSAVVETAKASGLGLVDEGERDAWAATTRGTGELIAAAAKAGAEQVIVTVGGSATTDGGAGALEALDEAGVTVPMDVLCDVRVPFEDAPRIFAPQKGADEGMVKRLDRQHIGNYGDRFRFTTLQTRYARFIDLWDRGLRAREEGRPGPFRAAAKTGPEAPPVRDRIMRVTTFTDPMHEMDKLHDLYDSLAEARRESGQEAIPFHKFAELVKTQVTALKEKGSAEVAFRVAVKEGKVAFTARAMKGDGDEE